jgi:predicted ATP-grasp superfamily ATP-dependent carboligase
VALLVLKIGRYPLGYSGLGAVRSLGRVGVPTYAVTEDRFTPLARSRYLTKALVAPTTGVEDEARLVEMIKGLARKLPGRAVVMPTDDEAAVLLAEHAADFAPEFILPAIASSLPRTLASKRGLYDTCVEFGFPTPQAVFPESFSDVEAFASSALFPVVVKNDAPFARLHSPGVAHTTVVATADDLLGLAREWPEPPHVVLQEYVPDPVGEDWIFHGYFDGSSECLVGFTGVKYRAWPPRRGVTTYARVVANEELAESVRNLARKLDYRGILDLDIRYDRRDDRYKLLDFNPRVGAQFRMFETDAGIDVARALHLDLTGRAVPPGQMTEGRGFRVEHLDVAAMLDYRSLRREMGSVPHGRGRVERAWWAVDDPVPTFVMTTRLPSLLLDRMKRR